MPTAVIKGAFPSEILDQERVWLAPDGRRHIIADIADEEVLLWGMDFLLANARFHREAWSAKTKQTYDPDERARRWVMNRPLYRALTKRLVELWQAEECKQRAQEAFDARTELEQSEPGGQLDDRGNGRSKLVASSHGTNTISGSSGRLRR